MKRSYVEAVGVPNEEIVVLVQGSLRINDDEALSKAR
jgi:hypothetical protein